MDVVAKNPVSRVKLLAENNEQMHVLSFEDEQAYLAAASQPLKDFAVIMLETGMRPDEVRRITKANVNFTEGYVFNPHGKTKAARRKIPLTARATEPLFIGSLPIAASIPFYSLQVPRDLSHCHGAAGKAAPRNDNDRTAQASWGGNVSARRAARGRPLSNCRTRFDVARRPAK